MIEVFNVPEESRKVFQKGNLQTPISTHNAKLTQPKQKIFLILWTTNFDVLVTDVLKYNLTTRRQKCHLEQA